MKNEYDVGYGKPPKAKQFKEGQSGNSKGRPKGSKNVYTLLEEILNQKIALKENGKDIKISKKAAMLMQLTNRAIKGDVRAISVLFPHIITADLKAEEKEKVLDVLAKDDKAIMQMFIGESKGGKDNDNTTK